MIGMMLTASLPSMSGLAGCQRENDRVAMDEEDRTRLTESGNAVRSATCVGPVGSHLNSLNRCRRHRQLRASRSLPLVCHNVPSVPPVLLEAPRRRWRRMRWERRGRASRAAGWEKVAAENTADSRTSLRQLIVIDPKPISHVYTRY